MESVSEGLRGRTSSQEEMVGFLSVRLQSGTFAERDV